VTGKMTREDLIAALKDEHGIDVDDLQARAERNFAAVKIIGEAAVRAGKLIRGEEEDGDHE
jgi:hypothetical protein